MIWRRSKELSWIEHYAPCINWIEMVDNFSVLHLPFTKSDHSLILINMNEERKERKEGHFRTRA